MSHAYIYDDFWNIFSTSDNNLNGLQFVAACQKLNIDLSRTQQQALSQTTFKRTEWMDLMQNEYMNQSIDKWKKLHSYYLNNIDRDNIKCTKNTLCCYQWRLPKYKSFEIKLLCSGFLRKKSNIFIPIDVISILMYYVFDNTIIDKIKMSKNYDRFESGIFEYKSCKFCMKLNNYKQKIDINIVWLDRPKYISKIIIYLSFNVVEKFINLKRQIIYRFGWCSSHGMVIESHIALDQIQHLDTMTFNICIQKFIAYGKNENIVFSDNYIPRDRVPLIMGTPSRLVEPLQDALKSIFEQFATNEDDTMSVNDLKKYILYCDAGKISVPNEIIQGIFDKHGTETYTTIDEHQDTFSYQGFLNFYRQACIDRPDDVWNDLKVFKYGNDLKIEKMEDDEEEQYIKPIIVDESMGQSKNTDTFEWYLSDDEIKKMRNCKPKDVIQSKVFIMHKLKWQIWLLPSGINVILKSLFFYCNATPKMIYILIYQQEKVKVILVNVILFYIYYQYHHI